MTGLPSTYNTPALTLFHIWELHFLSNDLPILAYRVSALAILTVGLPLLLSGCHSSRTPEAKSQTKTPAGAENDANPDGSPLAAGAQNVTLTQVPIPRIARWQGPDRGNATQPPSPQLSAITRGKLAVVRNCLVILTGGAKPIVPIFPYGKGQWDSVSQTFRHDGKSYRLGDEISLGGGMAPTNPGQYLGKHELPDCDSKQFWISY
jgi:hypothetical protein